MERGGQASREYFFYRPPERRRTHVFRLSAAESDPELDARPKRNHQLACAAVYGRNLRLFSAGSESAVEEAAVDAAQASARVRVGHRAGNAESGGFGL